MINLIFGILGIAFLFCIYMLIRNELVCSFRIKIIMAGDNFEGSKIFFPKLPQYDSMLYDFKPVTLKSYFTKEEATELKRLLDKKKTVAKSRKQQILESYSKN